MVCFPLLGKKKRASSHGGVTKEHEAKQHSCFCYVKMHLPEEAKPVYDESGVYQSAPLPSNERARMRVLHHTGLLEDVNHPGLDHLTKLLGIHLNCHGALVTLISDNFQMVKSQYGDLVSGYQTRSHSICCWSFLDNNSNSVLAINDLSKDDRFRDNPFVCGNLKLRAYIGAPITILGYRVGNLCALDTRPREWDETEIELVGTLAEVASTETLSRSNDLTELVHKEKEETSENAVESGENGR